MAVVEGLAAKMAPMDARERPDSNDPACPLLGLEADRQTRFTFPHAAHRCHGGRIVRGIAPAYQATHCLAPAFATCERLQAWARGHDLEIGQSPGGSGVARDATPVEGTGLVITPRRSPATSGGTRAPEPNAAG